MEKTTMAELLSEIAGDESAEKRYSDLARRATEPEARDYYARCANATARVIEEKRGALEMAELDAMIARAADERHERTQSALCEVEE